MIYPDFDTHSLVGVMPKLEHIDWIIRHTYTKKFPVFLQKSVSGREYRKAFPAGLSSIIRGINILKPFIIPAPDSRSTIILTVYNKWEMEARFNISSEQDGIYRMRICSDGSISIMSPQTNQTYYGYHSNNTKDFIKNVYTIKRCLSGKEDFIDTALPY